MHHEAVLEALANNYSPEQRVVNYNVGGFGKLSHARSKHHFHHQLMSKDNSS